MKGTSAKIVYCVGLFALAMFAVMPRHQPVTVTPVAISTPLSTEGRLARAITERIAIEVAGEVADGAQDVRINALSAQADGLRRLAFEDDAEGARQDLIDALANELSAAMAQRASLAANLDPRHHEVTKVEAIVRGLTAAINAEVRGASV